MGCGCKSKTYRVGQAGAAAGAMLPPSTHLSQKAPNGVKPAATPSDCGCNGDTPGKTLIHSQAAFPWGLALVGGVAIGWLIRSRTS